MLRTIALFAALILSAPLYAEQQRDVANQVAAPDSMVLASAVDDMHSFFEPKTESDINALATLGQEFEASLSQEFSN